MKKTLLLSFSLLLACSGFAQLQNYTSAPDFQLETIAGDTFDLYKTLDSGKTVIVDVMATWCGPCWSWHEGEYFKDLYSSYGPDGTDELRVVMIEADTRTPESLLYQAAGDGSSAATTSLGDWVTGVEYPIINDDNFNDLYDIGYYPTIYAITPNRMVYEIGRYTDGSVYQDWHQNTPGLASADANGILLDYTGETSVCGSTVDAVFQFQNHSLNPLTEDFDVTVTSGGNVVAQTTITQDFAPYEIATISAGTLPASLTNGIQSDIQISASVTGDVDTSNDMLEETIGSPSAVSDSFTLNFTTGAYAVETSWTLRDSDGDIVLSAAYTGPAAGGGDDASVTFPYGFRPADTDFECYTFTVFDSYGDGIGYRMTATSPIPGVELLKENGDVVFSYSFFDDAQFEDSFDAPFAGAAETVSGVVNPIAGNIAAYPNPVQAGGSVTVTLDQLNTTGTVNARLMNALGQTVKSFSPNVAGAQMTFDLPTGVSGVHFLELSAAEGSSTVRLNVQ